MNSREAFEQVILANGGTVDRDGSGAYAERDVDISWLAWQAATERAAKVCDAVEERYEQAQGGLWPEMRTDAITGADQCGYEIREGNE